MSEPTRKLRIRSFLFMIRPMACNTKMMTSLLRSRNVTMPHWRLHYKTHNTAYIINYNASIVIYYDKTSCIANYDTSFTIYVPIQVIVWTTGALTFTRRLRYDTTTNLFSFECMRLRDQRYYKEWIKALLVQDVNI